MTLQTREMSDIERYRFDRDGFVVFENVLDDSTLEELNRRFDEQDLRDPSAASGNDRRFRDFLAWGVEYQDLLDHDRVMYALRDIFNDEYFRLDHYYGIYMEKGAETLGLHGGGEPYDPSQSYHYQNGSMFNGLTVVAWNLTDTGPEYGGFCGIPGSHKSNFACPADIKEAVEAAETPDELPEDVVVPEVPAGSVVIFTEALTHGTAPWVADHQRRSLLYKYSPGYMSWSSNYPEPPEEITLTNRQEALFHQPHHPYASDQESLFAEQE